MQRIYDEEDFKAEDNVGLRLVKDDDPKREVKLIDIDCDASEVVSLSGKFLPKCLNVYGRPSKSPSHYLYSSLFKKTIAFQDLTPDAEQKTLIEIRVDHQSMAPPSQHPSGEILTWTMIGKLNEIDNKVLLRSVRLCATAAMIARYYNPPGNRHNWGLAIAGYMKILGITEKEAVNIFKEAGNLANDDKVNDRLASVRTTFARDEAVQGAKALHESMLTGVAFTKTIDKIWGVTKGLASGKLKELNKKHALIFQQNGEAVIITEKDDEPLRFSNPGIMQLLYPELVVVGTSPRGVPVTKKLGAAWIDTPLKRRYEGIELAPKNGRPDYYNLWRGFSCEPKEGSWDKLKRHLYEVICDNRKDIYNYVFMWLANAVQNAHTHGHTAIALRGGQGTGKSSFAEWFGGLFGEHFLILNSTDQITGRFNGHLHNAIFVFADEAVWAGDKKGTGTLKRLITQNTINIERKGVDILSVKNHTHLMLASNDEWVVPAELDDRRFVVLDVNDERANDLEWFSNIDKEYEEEGGKEAFLYELQNAEIDIRYLKNKPHTRALSEQKEKDLNCIQLWWYTALQSKMLFGELWEGKREATIDQLHEDYLDFTEKINKRVWGRRKTISEMGLFIKKYTTSATGQRAMIKGKRITYRNLGTVVECRARWTEMHNIRFYKDSELY
jgi:hypothetical protein